MTNKTICAICGENEHSAIPHQFVDRPAENELAEHCTRSAAVYRKNPGLVCSLTTIDLYEICAQLAQRVKELSQ